MCPTVDDLGFSDRFSLTYVVHFLPWVNIDEPIQKQQIITDFIFKSRNIWPNNINSSPPPPPPRYDLKSYVHSYLASVCESFSLEMMHQRFG